MPYATVRIESLTGSPMDVKITDVKTGERIRPITAIDFHVDAHSLPVVTLTLEDALFYFEGRPEMRHELQTVAEELWSASLGNSPPSQQQLGDWAVRIAQQIAKAAGIGWETDKPASGKSEAA